jgi:hypothetical protein
MLEPKSGTIKRFQLLWPSNGRRQRKRRRVAIRERKSHVKELPAIKHEAINKTLESISQAIANLAI